MTLRPRLTAGLPFAPKHWQIHHKGVIGSFARDLNPRFWDFIPQKLGLEGDYEAKEQITRKPVGPVGTVPRQSPCRR